MILFSGNTEFLMLDSMDENKKSKRDNACLPGNYFSPDSEHCEASIEHIHMRFNGTGAKVHAVTLNAIALRTSSLGNHTVKLEKLKSVRFMAQE